MDSMPIQKKYIVSFGFFFLKEYEPQIHDSLNSGSTTH